MALNRKYSALPDLDTAPDIYETPELTDDNSTVPTTTARSDNGFDEDEETEAGISRSHLHVDQARSRFLGSSVDAAEADFSDRLDSKRKSYKTSSRRQRILEDGTEELGDLSDEDDGDSLARKIARLKREVEEAKEEYGKQKAAASGKGTAGTAEQGVDLESLSQVLDEISRLSDGPAAPTLADVLTTLPGEKPTAQAPSPTPELQTETSKQAFALAQAADFDRRLVLLERSIGIGSSTLPELDSGGLPRAIIPTLDTLQRQISTLSEASTASLDSISRRVRALIQEVDQLAKSRRSAKVTQEALAQARSGSSEAAAADDSEQTAKINALYGTLPTIENLTPLLPPLLDRLRSLRSIHADAATASETLDRIERRQAEMEADIKQWKEGLDKIEAAMKQGDAVMGGNVKVIEGWVKGLEEKLARLS